MPPDRHEWFLNEVFRYRSVLQRYLRKRFASEEEIEDVIQDTYLRIYALKDYEVVESPKSLLLRIAHNLAVERVRRRESRATRTMADFDVLPVSYDGMPGVENQVDARQRFEALCAAVDSLPPICRRAFVLKKVYSLSQDQIAAVLGVSQNTVEKHVAKGLVRCRDYFREHGLLQEGESRAATVSNLRKDGSKT